VPVTVQLSKFIMNADKYEAIKVLIITKGFEREGLQYRLTPYRFRRKNGQVLNIKKIRQHHTEIRGGSKQFQVNASNNSTFRGLIYSFINLSGFNMFQSLYSLR